MVSVSDGEAAARGGFAFSNGHSRRWLKAWGGFPRRHDNLTVFMEVRGGGWCLGLLAWAWGSRPWRRVSVGLTQTLGEPCGSWAERS